MNQASKPIKININPASSVVEIGLARSMLYLCGYGIAREPNNLVIYPERENNSLYIDKAKTEQRVIGRLFVDEGFFSYCLYETHLGTHSKPWDELVDFQSLLWFIIKAINPNYKPEPSPYMGRGRSQQHAIDQHIIELEQLIITNNEHPLLSQITIKNQKANN